MQHLLFFILSCCLFACVDSERDDLTNYVADTKSKSYSTSDIMPLAHEYQLIGFTQNQAKDPFSQPKKEGVAVMKNVVVNNRCSEPHFDRKKEVLEGFPLASMVMRGTMMLDRKLWALIQPAGGIIYRVKPGDYLGLNEGVVVKVSQNKIDVVEHSLDKQHCQQPHTVEINLVFKS